MRASKAGPCYLYSRNSVQEKMNLSLHFDNFYLKLKSISFHEVICKDNI